MNRVPARVMTFALLLILALTWSASAAQAPPSWIWSSKNPTDGQKVYFHRTFVAEPGIIQAVLLGVCDNAMVIHVNGKLVKRIEGFNKSGNADLTALIRPGENVIAIEASHRTGPAGVCLLVQLATDIGPEPVLMTDTTWRASDKFVEGWTKASFRAKGWKSATRIGYYGSPEVRHWGNPFDGKQTFDAYNSWKLAAGTDQATSSTAIHVPEGFKVQLLRSAQPSEGSWISMAFDPQGRLTVAKEKKGLLRMTLGGSNVSRVEVIEDTLLECRGLLYAYDSLYVNANNSKGFYRLKDKNNDGTFEERKLLLATEGGVGHGRNHVVLGPDGSIFLVHGNAVKVPINPAPTSPYKYYAEDQLINSPWDKAWSGGDIEAPGGHILRTDKDGSFFEVYAGGFRNEYDIAFNEKGQMFTHDADLEWDVGLPWYRPTRVNHVIPGGEYGWRRGTGKAPTYYPDTLPSVVDTGLGSPTGVEFGTKSTFPPKLRKALFICDWAYGRVMAVHMRESGSTYTGSYETFAQGRPLNVTDIKFGPDGAMYLITGGRGTQSGLYRISYVGKDVPEEKKAGFDDAAFEAQAARALREISQSHQKRIQRDAPQIIEELFVQMASEDRFGRYAARVALEHQDINVWFRRALSERNPRVALHALLALVRVGDANQKVAALSSLAQSDFRALKEDDLLLALRTLSIGFSRLGNKVDATIALSIRDKVEPLYPNKSWRVNHEMCELLTTLASTKVRDRTFQLLSQTDVPADMLHYLITMRYQQKGWNIEQLGLYFRHLNRASRAHRGRYYQQSVKTLRAEFNKVLPDQVKQHLGALLNEPRPTLDVIPDAVEAPKFVKDWKMTDLLDSINGASQGRKFESGRQAFVAARCVQCHQFGNLRPRADVGPDLSSVAARFSRKDLLESMINPSKAIGDKYRQSKIELKDGSVVVGMIVGGDDKQTVLQANPLSDETVTVNKADIAKSGFAETSSMPTGLLSVLTKEQILDLLAYLESSGNRHHKAFDR